MGINVQASLTNPKIGPTLEKYYSNRKWENRWVVGLSPLSKHEHWAAPSDEGFNITIKGRSSPKLAFS